jgi:hypothetical protein
MMLMTPLTAFAPHSAAPGPLMTSMRSMSSRQMIIFFLYRFARLGSVDVFHDFREYEHSGAQSDPGALQGIHVHRESHAAVLEE